MGRRPGRPLLFLLLVERKAEEYETGDSHDEEGPSDKGASVDKSVLGSRREWSACGCCGGRRCFVDHYGRMVGLILCTRLELGRALGGNELEYLLWP
jgi:hypothetical protein